MTNKFWSAFFLISLFVLTQAADGMCCGLGSPSKGGAADPDDDTAMSSIERQVEVV